MTACHLNKHNRVTLINNDRVTLINNDRVTLINNGRVTLINNDSVTLINIRHSNKRKTNFKQGAWAP